MGLGRQRRSYVGRALYCNDFSALGLECNVPTMGGSFNLPSEGGSFSLPRGTSGVCATLPKGTSGVCATRPHRAARPPVPSPWRFAVILEGLGPGGHAARKAPKLQGFRRGGPKFGSFSRARAREILSFEVSEAYFFFLTPKLRATSQNS